MPDIDAWLADDDAEPISAASRAGDAWARILDDPTWVTFKRGSTILAAQKVRVEYSNSSGGSPDIVGQAGRSARIAAILFGVKDHPTLPDFNVQFKDRCALDGVQYQVNSIIHQVGEIQAICEVLS
jgi:hypothetical protein